MKKIELVITSNIVLQEEIDSLFKEDSGFSIDTFYAKDEAEIANFLQINAKIDLVIIDNILDIASISKITNISKVIINMLPSNSFGHYINLTKPFRIKELIDIINKSRNSKFIYEVIWPNLIFNEEASVILNISSCQNIILTKKENALIAKLFLAKNHIMRKEDILEDLWGYSNNSETSTLETHIYRLKNKLPDGLLWSKDRNIGLSTLS